MPLPGRVPSLTGSSPAASDACECTPAWNAEKSRIAYGLAIRNENRPIASASAHRRAAPVSDIEPPEASVMNAVSRHSIVIPPVYLVAAASPIPAPAIA